MSKTLLLADDSVVIQKLVGLSFASEDVEIVSTDNGDDAVTKAREIRPDVVLADVVMPGKSGYEVCEAIKQDPSLAHIPVLLLTGTFEAFDEARAQAAGATGHITKPFEAQALVERVKTVIKNASQAAAAAASAARPAVSDGARSASRIEVGPAIPAQRDFAASGPPLADDLFTDDDPLLSSPGDPSYFGTVESLDVTPSIGEEDLSDALDPDLFGPPGDVGQSTPQGGESFSAAVESLEMPEAPSAADSARSGALGESMYDATTEFVGEALDESMDASSSFTTSATSATTAFTTDLGLDDPVEVAALPAESFDLDSAFDPEPPQASAPLGFARDDANAATSRSLDRPVAVTDLDEFLASPATSSATAFAPAPAAGSSPSSPSTPPAIPLATPPPVPAGAPSALRPEAPTLLDLGPAEQSGGDLDFGFDVSEQATLSNVDLLEESFTSLLDVSDAQRLGESAPSFGAPAPGWVPAAPLDPETTPSADFDVSSGDLAATSFPQAAAHAMPPSIEPPASPSPSFDVGASDVPPPLPASAFPDAPRRSASVDDMSPILQQQVQETLEKVAWEAFSDLSETIVKQVIERIERIAWEVIPQMAETLVREEIRKMKGDVE